MIAMTPRAHASHRGCDPRIRSRCWIGAKSHISPRDRQNDQNRRRDEAEAGNKQAGKSRADQPELNRQLRRAGAGDEIDGGNQVKEMLPVDPAASMDDFIFHHCNMRGRPAKGGEAQPREEGGDFAQLSAVRAVGTDSWV